MDHDASHGPTSAAGPGAAPATSSRSGTDRLIETLLPRGTLRRQGARWLKSSVKRIRRKLAPERSTHIFVACFQKSGSSYLTELLSEITGFPSRALLDAYGHNEQDVHAHALEDVEGQDTVTQQHARGTTNNVKLLQRFRIKPVVLVRDIFDVTVSLYDHIEGGRHVVPTGYVHREYWNLSRDQKLLYLIRVHLPWYFNFFVSWREASRDMPVLWLTYEELFADQVATVSRVLEFYGLAVDPAAIQEAIRATTAGRHIRYNVGVAGRGQGLSALHKQAIVDIASVWGIDRQDMRMIGIP
jgi:hypothetical protein